VSRVALVTGGSRGIGRAIAERLAADGHQVAINYTANKEAAEAAVDAITAAGGTAIAVQGDVGDPEAVAEIFEAVIERLGPVEILVNNAGITRDGLILRMGIEAWDDVIETNLRSVYLATKTALRSMLRAKWGRIISISSVSGIAGNPGQANYAASKAGIIGFTKSVAREVGSRGITVNAVAPGFIETDMTEALGEEITTAAAERIALGRLSFLRRSCLCDGSHARRRRRDSAVGTQEEPKETVMDRSEIESKLTDLLVDELGIDRDSIALDARFEEDLDVDSLGVVELLMALEDNFGVKIPDEEAEQIATVGEAVDLVEKKLN
jgi:3-oxoacyl-[acyl-carrier protein] reductase